MVGSINLYLPECFLKSPIMVLVGASGGFLLHLAYPNQWGINHWAFMLFGLAFWFFGIDNPRLSRWQRISFTAGFSFTFFSLNLLWTWQSMGYFLPWLAFAGLMSLFFLVLPLINEYFWAFPKWYLLITPAIFTVTESWRATWPWGGASWPNIAWSQVDSPLGYWAPWVGETGVIFLTALLSYAISRLFMWNFSLPAFKSLGFWILIILLPGLFSSLFGVPTFKAGEQTSPRKTLTQADKKQLPAFSSWKVAFVQGNVKQPIAQDFNTPYQIFRRHLDAADYQQLQKAQIILLGEQAAEDPRRDGNSELLLEFFQKQSGGKPILFGTAYWENSTLRVNEALLLLNGQGIAGSYIKQRPVPFGEYLPDRKLFEKIFPPAKHLVPADMRFGNKTGVISVKVEKNRPAVKVGVNICFETAIESVVGKTVKQGAEFLWIPTNNASFGDYGQAETQLLAARFRAKEYHRSSAQVSINGVSALIDAQGQIRAQTKLFTADQKLATLALHNDLTPAIWIAPALHFLFKYVGSIVIALLVGCRIFSRNFGLAQWE